MNLSIVYWNTVKNSEATIIVLEDRREYNIIVLQEILRSLETGRAYCPALGRYRIVYTGKGRAAIYIHKHYTVARQSQEAGDDWCRVTFRLRPEALTVQSIYSLYESERREDGLQQSPLQRLTGTLPEGRHILVGDMNLYHLLQDKEGRISTYIYILLSLVHHQNLELAIPQGEPTQQRTTEYRDDRDRTIDYTQYSATLRV